MSIFLNRWVFIMLYYVIPILILIKKLIWNSPFSMYAARIQCTRGENVHYAYKKEWKKHQLLYALKMANGTDFITGRIILYGIFFASVYTHTHIIYIYILYSLCISVGWVVRWRVLCILWYINIYTTCVYSMRVESSRAHETARPRMINDSKLNRNKFILISIRLKKKKTEIDGSFIWTHVGFTYNKLLYHYIINSLQLFAYTHIIITYI